MSNLEAQIELITVPQEFVRLCNAVLGAEHGVDFLPVDDDRADRGNDGYLKSAKRLYAMHCFKRVQKQSIDSEIRRKMVGDLGKAVLLKKEEIWEIDAWTFLCNYPIPEQIGARIVEIGAETGIDVSWKGPSFLATALQRHPEVRDQFPDLQVNEIGERLAEIQSAVMQAKPMEESSGRKGEHGVPSTPQEQSDLVLDRPPGWEFLLFAGVLTQGKRTLELKWHDYEMPPFAVERGSLPMNEAFRYLSSYYGRLSGLITSMHKVFAEGAQEQAFGLPGEAGDPVRIEHFAKRVLDAYEGLLDSAAELRSMDLPDLFDELVEISVRIPAKPLRQIRDFIDRVVRETEKVPAFVADPNPDKEPLKIELMLVLTLDDELVARHDTALDRAQKAVEQAE